MYAWVGSVYKDGMGSVCYIMCTYIHVRMYWLMIAMFTIMKFNIINNYISWNATSQKNVTTYITMQDPDAVVLYITPMYVYLLYFEFTNTTYTLHIFAGIQVVTD